MSHTTTIFERETLYEQVWAQPLRAVAASYGLSDVGLRKICKRLGVPVPPLGYWAKVAAGKRPRVATLSPAFTGATRYVRQVYVDEYAPEREQRTISLLERTAFASPVRAVVKPSLDSCQPSIRRTGKLMTRRKGDSRHLLFASGGDVFEVAVSETLKDRALRILDAILTALLAVGGELESGSKDGKRLFIRILGEPVGMRIEEIFRREERKLTAAEVAERAKNTYFYFRDRWVYSPTGKLKLTLIGDNEYNPLATLSDGASSFIEDRIENIAALVLAKAAERQVQKQMDEEDRLRREMAWAQHQELVRARDAELTRLKNVEQEVTTWRRAQELRAFANAMMDAIAEATDERAEKIAWILNAADWLDPLAEKYWPVVDIER